MYRELGAQSDGGGLLRHDAGKKFEMESAGTKASPVRPEAIAAMKELGINISGQRSKNVDESAGQTVPCKNISYFPSQNRPF